MRFFSYESRFSQLLLKLCWSCWLNILWFLCSLPIFTIGAATTALYYASLKIVREEETNVTAMFFRSFRENFKQATGIWLILLALLAVMGIDLRMTAVLPSFNVNSISGMIILRLRSVCRRPATGSRPDLSALF